MTCYFSIPCARIKVNFPLSFIKSKLYWIFFQMQIQYQTKNTRFIKRNTYFCEAKCKYLGKKALEVEQKKKNKKEKARESGQIECSTT